MDEILTVFVPGLPATAGSKTGRILKYPDGRSRVILMPANKGQKPWMEAVKYAVYDVFDGPMVKDAAVHLSASFYFMRPKSHFRSGKNADRLKKCAPAFHVYKPDLSKLVRCVEDAMTGLVWRDDSQVEQITAGKYWASRNGARIVVQLI